MYMYTIDQPFSCRNSRGNINIQIYIWFLTKLISLHFSALWWRKWLKLSSWHIRTHLSYKVICVAVNVLVKSVVRATAAIVLILTLEPIRFSARGGFNSWIGNIIDNSWRGSHIFVKIYILHWRGGVILVGFSLLAALRGVILSDTLRCGQWWESRRGEDISVSVFCDHFEHAWLLLLQPDEIVDVLLYCDQRGCLGFGREEIDTLVPCVTVRGMNMRKGHE